MASELAGLIASDPAEPFTPERIVIPHRTTERWLQLEIARKLGIAANLDFELPAQFAWSILRGAVPTLSKAQGFSPDTLRWHLFELLPDFARGADAAEVRRFLADGDERKRFELSDKLAGVFDRCVNFRPDWIRDWEQGATPYWQARLWQLLAKKVPEQHWVRALDEFGRELAGGIEPKDWPRRAFVFGVSALSPSYLQLLEKLGEFIELHFFLFNPSENYWREIRTQREMRAPLESRSKDGEVAVEDLHFEMGNELLAAWGRWSQDTFGELAGAPESEELFPAASDDSRLAAVQGDIQALRPAADARVTDAEATRVLSPDASLQIHCCHSPMREAEVLHDCLLDLLENNTDIEPADIMILTPDLARYGPAVAAVFEAEGRIPVSLSRFRATDSATARAFLDLLSLPASSYGIDAVLAPLEASRLRARFGIEETSLPAIREWVCSAGVRRGIEAGGADRDSAPVADHTWREGLRRLLMGYAVGDRDELALGVASLTIHGAAGFEAGEADYEALGRFIAYCDLAFELRSRVAAPRPAADWVRLLRNIVSRFFDDGSELAAYADFEAARIVAEELEELRALLDRFEQQLEPIDCRISFEVILTALKEEAAGAALGPARLADGATIGNLKPGQILPAGIVCVVGMNGDSFPRNPHRHAFDLVEMDKRRSGDRDVRQEDRFAFLEALLAARTAFVATYSGRDQRDDAGIPPSVVLEELIDYLAVRFPDAGLPGTAHGNEDDARGRQWVEHPLQPFSSRYFAPDADNRLFSYSATMLQAARALWDGAEPEWRWSASLPELPSRELSLTELEQFFANPARDFLRDRFGIRLSDDEDSQDEYEPLEINSLEKYQLRAELIKREGIGRAGQFDYERLRPRELASGALPHGGFGELIFDDAESALESLNTHLDEHAAALAAEPTRIEFEVAGFQVAGYLPNIGKDDSGQPYMVWWRNGKRRSIDLIAIHLRQLAWQAALKSPLTTRAFWLDKTEIIAPPGDPSNVQSNDPSLTMMASWLEARWRGLSAPLPFFPETSLAYARKFAKGDGGLEACLAAARVAWRTESGKPHNRLLWDPDAGAEPISEEFQQLAERLLLPFVSCEFRR